MREERRKLKMDEIRRGDKELRDIVDKLKQGDITAIEGKTEFINSMAMLNMSRART